MSFSQEPIPTIRSDASVKLHGPDTPFRHYTVIQKYIEALLDRNVLEIQWWQEEIDDLVVASGHYSVPYVPDIPRLKEFATRYPGRVEHIKEHRHPEKYRDKSVITVGASVSTVDAAFSLAGIAQTPVHAVVCGKYIAYFGDKALKHPRIQRHFLIEKQSVLAARVLAGRAALPELEEQHKWEKDQIQKRGDGVPFTLISPDIEEYFETLRRRQERRHQASPGDGSHYLIKRGNEVAQDELGRAKKNNMQAKL
ncbi:hypothetical protein N8T08_001731 [Aspergillus melleus]|uniref:Uncharacterized protein n=1 Tax=Aspergillus melleus TaxID=138277 RepID=A0ACC3AMT5_9EURO|nr:hypothetical protein N8T08_001731 [Aspergillus melleus]